MIDTGPDTLESMSTLLIANVVSTAAYLGFQATVRVVVYPQFAHVPAGTFAAYVVEHQRRITYLVGPLFAALVLTTAAAFVRTGESVPAVTLFVQAGAVLTVLAATALLAVPEHRRLGAGWDVPAYRRLLHADTIRLIAALLACVAAVVRATT